MSIGMLVHEGSILVVIFNGMRLLNYHLQGKRDRKKMKANPTSETAYTA